MPDDAPDSADGLPLFFSIRLRRGKDTERREITMICIAPLTPDLIIEICH